MKCKVSGQVATVEVVEGRAVHKSDRLYTLVDSDYARNVSLAQVAMSRAKLQLENAEVERARREKALASRGISQAEYDMARREVDLAKNAVNTAWVQLQVAQDRLNYCVVTSPIDGVVIRRNVEPGEVVTAGMTATVNGDPQMTVAQVDRLLLELDLNQVDVAKVTVGQEARILLDAYPGEEVKGVVSQIAAAGHLYSARGIDVFTVKVEVDPKQSEVEIEPGMKRFDELAIGNVDLIALAKGKKESPALGGKGGEQIFVPWMSNPVVLAPSSPELLLLDKIRDEAHRFAVAYHRKLRRREYYTSPLDEIPGIGIARKKNLIKCFGSIEGIRNATIEQLTEIGKLPAKHAAEIFRSLHKAEASIAEAANQSK